MIIASGIAYCSDVHSQFETFSSQSRTESVDWDCKTVEGETVRGRARESRIENASWIVP
jgi:hypothetical protein